MAERRPLCLINGEIKMLPAGDTLPGGDLSAAVILAPASALRNVIQPTGATIPPLILKGASAQSANLQEWQNSSATALAWVNPAGEYMTARGSGSNNLLLGTNALKDLTSGSGNVGIGVDAMRSITTASGCVAIGRQAGYSNTSGGALFIGDFAGYSTNSGLENTAVGTEALYANTSGNSNTAFGYRALNNATASQNTAIGWKALGGGACTGNNNTAVGHGTLRDSTSGTNNLAIGYYACFANTTANNNIGIGSWTLQGNSTGANNVAIGAEALYNLANVANCVGIGYQAGNQLTSGTNCTFIGYAADFASSTQRSNATAIGYGAKVNADNTVRLGNDSVAVLEVTAAAFFVMGDAATDGSWRIGRSGNDLLFQRRESGSWVTKSTVTP